ncbi:hypothetical protein RSOL_282260 [Rhizoctonia solani AG-3 Rhs1AP]|uniref:MYND-type domain-containing protein n=1 Tax=Rhizoctonia solani AG-3 Rhs1AP TaxID=1086054 RepID=A0A0A1UIG3_9AGAM|nr:hypothetical protein RSOL_282260 [Rhizoctonia solani AG-3 Rhs1AP]
MLTTLNNERHGHWGRAFPDYLESYTNQALAVPTPPPDEPTMRVKAVTIDMIDALGWVLNGVGKMAAKHISLSMLKSILDASKNPEGMKELANPKLVAGCVELLGVVEPLFGYEYGYVCFRILNLAIGACMLRKAGQLGDTLGRMSLASESYSVFWADCAVVVYSDLQGKGAVSLGLCAAFTADVLDRLVELLYANQKQYFIILKELQSMGLSGLMLVLRAHIQDGGVETPSNMHGGALNERFKQPYSRLLWRYLLAVPVFIEHEAQAAYEIHLYVTYWARFRDSHFVDLEDSRNLLQAFNERLLSTRMVHLTGVMILMRFVEPLVVRGCEDLIPTLVERSLRLMWSSVINDGPDTSTARALVGNLLTCIRYILQEVEPKSFKYQQWIVDLVDCIIDEGLTDLVLRVLVAAPDFVPDQLDATERLYNAASEFYEELVYIAPKSYLTLRLNDSGTLTDWQKYITHFFGAGDISQESALRSTRKGCGEVIVHTLMAVLDKSHMDRHPVSASCDNPRCPMPCDAAYICSECVDLVYCDVRCLTADWSAPWRGLHKRVCQRQAMANPKSRSNYHRIIEDPGRKGMNVVPKSDMDAHTLLYYCGNK